MKLKYTHTRLLVSRFRECFRFYRDVLDFKDTFGTEDGTYADFDLGGVALALFDQAEMSATLGTQHKAAHAESQDSICLVFEVESVDDAYQKLSAEGVHFAVGPTDHPDWGIRTAHFRDPEGNLIEINESLAK
jgi:predicted enzyme related to lactoylglutathione lyase